MSIKGTKIYVVDKRKGHFHFPVFYGNRKEDLCIMGRISHDPPEGLYFESEIYSFDEQSDRWDKTGIVLPNLSSSAVETGNDTLVMPFYFMEYDGSKKDLAGDTFYLDRSSNDFEAVPKKVVIRGFSDDFAKSRWNRDDDHPMVSACTDGNVIVVDNGTRYLGLFYGQCEKDIERTDRRYSLFSIACNADDLYEWEMTSLVAGPGDVATGREGPCEASLVRLGDGRILCAYRVGCFSVGSGSNPAMDHYYKSFSSDEGKTWTEPEPFDGAWAVEPRFIKMSNGTIVLSGGRPGIYLWICRDGNDEKWEKVNIVDIHNELIEDKNLQIIENYEMMDKKTSTEWYQTTSYTDIREGEPGILYLAYDRIPYGWKIVPEDDPEFQAIFVMKLKIF